MPGLDVHEDFRSSGAALAGPMAGYGAQPAAPPALLTLASRIDEILEAGETGEARQAIAELLGRHLRDPALRALRSLPPDRDHYARHLLYADPLRRYSMLALVWAPGQCTPVHGHTAWGAVGILSGGLSAVSYELRKDAAATFRCCELGTVEVGPGETTTVHAGLEDVHRIANRTRHLAVSLHVYGKDLLAEPAGLNIILDV